MTRTHPIEIDFATSVFVIVAMFGLFVILAVHAALVTAQIHPADAIRTLIYSPQWSTLFHLGAFFLIFLGIIIRPLKEKLDKGGAAVAVGFAAILSASLVVTGRFNLLNFEPIAALGIFVLFGAVVAAAFKKLYDASWPTTAATGFVCGYASLRIAAPSLLPTLPDLLIAAELGYAFAIVWLIYKFISTIITDEATHWPAHAIATLSARPPQARQRLHKELALQKDLATLATHQTQEQEALASELEEAIRAIKTQATGPPEVRKAVKQRLQDLAQAARNAQEELQRYKTLSERVEELDAEEYAELKEQFDQLPLELQAEALQELHSLRSKLKVDAIQDRLTKAIQANSTAVSQALSAAQADLAAGDTKAALRALNDAKKAEAEALRLTAQIKRFADQFTAAAERILERAGKKAAAGTLE